MKKFIFIHETKYGVDVYPFQLETELSDTDLVLCFRERIMKALDLDFDRDRDSGTIVELVDGFKTIDVYAVV